ncbi:MAG: lysoplasmalogenase [Paucibacter sp.]|nr:lysoplasmalogenase [Roseateles sp.]
MKRLLPPLTLLSAVLAILALDVLHWPPELGAALKGLTTVLVIAWAWPRGKDLPMVRRFVLAGLLASLVGDLALMFPSGFIPGLLAFLAAHLAYLWGFTRVQRFAAWPPVFAAYGALAAVVLSYLWPGIAEGLRVPVVAYVLCLASMAAQAGVIAWRARNTADAKNTTMLAFGGLMFFCSDGLLATNKFAGPVPLAAMLVLPTYWTAQWCIASWLKPREEG